MFRELGETVARVAQVTPGGVLMFFPSYRVQETAYEEWANLGLIEKIEAHKALLREPKDSVQYQQMMELYYSHIFEGEKRGAVLMGVCRGRISEGLDFTDNAARCVIVVGIPFPLVKEPRVIFKKHYLDSRCKDYNQPQALRSLNGNSWYN